jgi:hypothetical protein
MTQKEVTARLCLLQTTVNQRVFNYAKATDCICRNDDPFYQNSGEVLAFIEAAVEEKLQREGY